MEEGGTRGRGRPQRRVSPDPLSYEGGFHSRWTGGRERGIFFFSGSLARSIKHLQHLRHRFTSKLHKEMVAPTSYRLPLHQEVAVCATGLRRLPATAILGMSAMV